MSSLGDLVDPGVKPVSLVSPALAGGFFTTIPRGKPMLYITHFKNNELLYNFTCNIYLMHNNTFRSAAATAAKSLQSCPTLCDPIDGSPPRSPVLAWILQARTLEWIAISSSDA